MCYTGHRHDSVSQAKEAFFLAACFIFSAGSYYGLPCSPQPGDLILAADAGYLHCLAAGLTPHRILGDFDSMPQPQQREVDVFPVEKDDTDTMLAIRKGLESGCTEFHILGGTGGTRLDHTIANLQALGFLSVRGARGYLYDRNYTYTAITNSSLSIPCLQEDAVFSVFCLGADAQGVSIRGAKYCVEDAELSAAFPLGVSNHFLAGPAEISVREGTLLIGWQTEFEATGGIPE
ncbi:MAG: thiamine diphosphokinase [Oscillospiraceae bacterium]|nr:thiamine diphosphokinase [Oscillospiraceae bacterium]